MGSRCRTERPGHSSGGGTVLNLLSKWRPRRAVKVVVPVVLVALLTLPAAGEALPLDFESVEDVFGTGTVVDTQFAADGVLFSNTLALTAGISLNEFDYPPRSGATAVRDSGGGLTIDFTKAFYGVEAYFTYDVPVTLQAFDASGALLAQAMSAFSSNLASNPAASPNERIGLVASVAIARVIVTGDALGDLFVMDDFNAFAAPPTPAPEPSAAVLALLGLAAAWRVRRRRE